MKSIDQVFCHVSLNWDQSDLMIRLRLCVWGKRATERLTLYLCQGIASWDNAMSVGFIPSDINPDHLVKGASVDIGLFL